MLVCKLVAHYVSGLYSRSWFTFGVSDLPAVFRAVFIGSTGAILAATYFYRFERFSRGVFIIDAILLLLAIRGEPPVVSADGSCGGHAEQPREARPDLRVGRARPASRARDAGKHAWAMRPIGFVGPVAASEHSILGVRVFGTPDDLPTVVRRLRVEELVLSGDPLDSTSFRPSCASASRRASRFESWSSKFANRLPRTRPPARHDRRGLDRQLERRSPAAPVPGVARTAATTAGSRHRRRQRQHGRLAPAGTAGAPRCPAHPASHQRRLCPANNIAAGRCERFDALALLNPDAFPEPEWLDALVGAADRDPTVAAFASQMLLVSSPDYLDGAGDSYHVSGRAWRNGHPYAPRRMACRRRRGLRPLRRSRACTAVRAFDEVGGFDEQYFCYFEDVDLGFRLRLRGYRCVYVHTAVVRHVSSALSGYRSNFAVYHGERNAVWTFVKDMPGPLLWIYLPQHLALNLAALGYYTWRGQGRIVLKAKLDAVRGLPSVLRRRKIVQGTRLTEAWKLRLAFKRGVWSMILRSHGPALTRKASRLPGSDPNQGFNEPLTFMDSSFSVPLWCWIVIRRTHRMMSPVGADGGDGGYKLNTPAMSSA